MGIIGYESEEQIDRVECQVCHREISTLYATVGMVDSDGEQTFACSSHIRRSESRNWFKGWTDFVLKRGIGYPAMDELFNDGGQVEAAGCYTETHECRSADITPAIMAHLTTRIIWGDAIIVCDSPASMQPAYSKWWAKVVEKVRHEYVVTRDISKKLGLEDYIFNLGNTRFKTGLPSGEPRRIVWVVAPDQLEKLPESIRTVYVTSDVPMQQLLSWTGQLEGSGAVLQLHKQLSNRRPLTEDDIYKLMLRIAFRKQEHLICLSLDSGSRLIANRVIAIGTLNSVQSHPREVFADAIKDRAASVIVAHNHPSGDAEPSNKDIELTQQLAAAGQILGVPMLDHIIVAEDKRFSFRREGLL